MFQFLFAIIFYDIHGLINSEMFALLLLAGSVTFKAKIYIHFRKSPLHLTPGEEEPKNRDKLLFSFSLKI